MRAPSLLPGWTRGHLVAHLANSGEALANVLNGLPPYASQEARNADIEAGSGRSAAELIAAFNASTAALRALMAATFDEESAGRWEPSDGAIPAGQVPVR